MKKDQKYFEFADELGVVQKVCELIREEIDFQVYHTEAGWFIKIQQSLDQQNERIRKEYADYQKR